MFAKSNMLIIKNKISILDQSRSALTMTTSSAVGQLGANGNCATVG